MVALATYLSIEPRLQQTVSPQLIAQSEILELTAQDLQERVNSELESNPALELADDVYHLPPPVRCFPECSGDLMERLCAPDCFADELRLQLAPVTGRRRSLCEYLIECLDERGFLEVDLRETAAELRVTLPEMQAAVATIQALEPAGVGARSLCECLLLQIRRMPADEVPPGAAEFVAAFLSAGRRRSPARTARQLGLGEPDLAQIIEFVRNRLYLWPADCSRNSRPAATPVLPDAWIEWHEGELRVRVAQSWSQTLRVSEAWARLDREMRRTSEPCPGSAETVPEYIQRARAFIETLSRRENMLQRVTQALVELQADFFLDGCQALTPLTRKHLALTLGVHESTVSRITSGKHVQLPDGQLVSYDFFFDGSLSAKSVLRSLIEREERRQPLSDAALAERLQAAGYPLARRTVAKYREQLGIPSVRERRQ